MLVINKERKKIVLFYYLPIKLRRLRICPNIQDVPFKALNLIIFLVKLPTFLFERSVPKIPKLINKFSAFN